MNTVEPIRDQGKLAEIFDGLEHDGTWHGKRMYLLVTTLFYTGLRVGDVLQLRKKNVTGAYIVVVEQKTGKKQRIRIPRDLRTIYDERLETLQDDDYLFPSRKRRPDGTMRPITTRQAAYDMEIIKKRFGINFPFACHSWRKTHGYVRYVYGHDPIEVIRQHFNQANEWVTRCYIGIDEDERNKNLIDLKAGSYRPTKPTQKMSRKRGDSVALEVKRQTGNGRLWGIHMQERVRRRKEQEEADEAKKQQRKARKKITDHARYERKKGESEGMRQ